jgi:uncharacterized protein (TIGR03382 family)
MLTRFASALACVAALATVVLANGRPPQTSSITFRPGAEREILAGTSFGLLFSKDNGATWRWMCEDALPYGGMYDPDYEIMNSGTLLATTFDGLKVNRDGCVFDSTVLAPAPPALKFFSVLARSSSNILYAAAADPTDANIYKSTTDGTSFTTITQPGMLNDWYQSLEVAPSDPNRLYVSGYRFVTGGSGTTKEFFMFTSNNAGGAWTPMSLTGITTMSNSTLEIAALSRTNPLHLFARVTLEDNAIADGVYESTNGGTSWTKIRSEQGSISVLLRANGDLVLGTQTRGSFKRVSGAPPTTFTPIANAPHINCLVENSAGEVWACTQNYGSPAVPTDNSGIMKTTDLVTWTTVLRYQEIFEPVSCPASTLQYMKCDQPPSVGGPLGWCGLCAQLGCDPKRVCPSGEPDAPPDAGPGSGKGKGCCDAGDGAPGVLAFGVMIGIVLLRRRRCSRA